MTSEERSYYSKQDTNNKVESRVLTEEYADEPDHEEHAFEKDGEGEEEGNEETDDDKSGRRRLLLFGAFCCCLLLIIAIVLGVVLGGNKKDDEQQTSKASGSSPASSPPPPTSIAPITPSPSPLNSIDPEMTPAPSDGGVNTTNIPTSLPTPVFTNETEAPTQDPSKTFFPVVADTYIEDGVSSDVSFGTTSELLEVVSTSNLNSLALLQFNLSELPPPESDSILLENSFVLRLVHAGGLTGSLSPEITISRLNNDNLQDDISMDTLTWNDIVVNSSLPETLIMMNGPKFTVSNETTDVQVDISELFLAPPESGASARRRAAAAAAVRDLQQEPPTTEGGDGAGAGAGRITPPGVILLAIHIQQEDGPGSESFHSREGGGEEGGILSVAPVIIHEYVLTEITSCNQNPCGHFATCWELDGGKVTCECDDGGDTVDFLQNCPENCLQDKIYDPNPANSPGDICVCPDDKPEEDDQGFCFAAGSPCLENPCTGVGATCHDLAVDGETSTATPTPSAGAGAGGGGYVCQCSDDSVVLETENCDFATITSCDPPYPCAIDAVCFTEENSQLEITVGCQCPLDGRTVGFGESCSV